MTKQKAKTKAKKAQKKPRKFPIWATIFTIIGIIILCSLGYWQTQRLAWKTALLNEISEATSADPMNNRLALTSFIRGDKTGKEFMAGYMVGRFDHDKEIIVGPRTYKGLAGYHVITPLRLENGGTVLVNRGWVPDENINSDSRPQSLVPGVVVVAGIARKPGKPNRFTPENNIEEHQWYWLDIKAAAQKHRLDSLAPYVLYEQQQGLRPYSYPIPLGMTWLPPNNHKQYAFFWFTMAGLLGLFYILRFMRKQKAY